MKNNKLDLNKFKELKYKTKIEYNSIGSIYCPALRAKIYFNSDGFHHLCYDNNRSERSKNIQYSKFIYFKKAVEILKKSTTIQEYRRSIQPTGKPDKSGLRNTKMVEWFSFFVIISFSNCIRIKIVVRRIGENFGNYHFWSVMPYWTLSNNTKIIGSRDIEDN